MIAIRIHPHRFDHFRRRLRAMPLAVRAGRPIQTIQQVLLHLLTLPFPIGGRRPLAEIAGLPINTPPNNWLLPAAPTPKLQSKRLPDFVQPEF